VEPSKLYWFPAKYTSDTLVISVANIPTTSVTGGTTEGQSGTTAASVNTSSLLYIALSFGFSLAVNAWIFFRVSGGLFNPAVSLGMVLVGLNVRTTLAGGTSITQGLFIEMFLTSLLMLAILLLAAEKHKATFIAPIGIGLALFVSTVWAEQRSRAHPITL
jgi:aquaporin related protein